MVSQNVSNITQGSVVTCFRCGGTITILPVSITVKQFEISQHSEKNGGCKT